MNKRARSYGRRRHLITLTIISLKREFFVLKQLEDLILLPMPIFTSEGEEGMGKGKDEHERNAWFLHNCEVALKTSKIGF